MKRTELIRKVRKGAAAAGLVLQDRRRRGPHDVFVVDGQRVSIPRHKEINEHTAVKILSDLEGKLGREWWID